MEWLELKIDTSPSGLDAVTALLEQQGVTGVIIDDEADFKDFLEHNRQYWDYVDEELLREKAGVSRVTFYLERNEAALDVIARVNRELGTTTVVITHNAVIAGMADRVVYFGDGQVVRIEKNAVRQPASELRW